MWLMNKDIWILILAAGKSSRMGCPKLTLPIREDSLIRLVTKKALGAKAARVAVVYHNENVKNELMDLEVECIENAQAHEGMSTSIKAGLEFVKKREAKAAVILLGDQPGLDSEVIHKVIQLYEETQSIIVQAKYGEQPAHPVLFDSSLFDELLELEGDR